MWRSGPNCGQTWLLDTNLTLRRQREQLLLLLAPPPRVVTHPGTDVPVYWLRGWGVQQYNQLPVSYSDKIIQ